MDCLTDWRCHKTFSERKYCSNLERVLYVARFRKLLDPTIGSAATQTKVACENPKNKSELSYGFWSSYFEGCRVNVLSGRFDRYRSSRPSHVDDHKTYPSAARVYGHSPPAPCQRNAISKLQKASVYCCACCSAARCNVLWTQTLNPDTIGQLGVCGCGLHSLTDRCYVKECMPDQHRARTCRMIGAVLVFDQSVAINIWTIATNLHCDNSRR